MPLDAIAYTWYNNGSVTGENEMSESQVKEHTVIVDHSQCVSYEDAISQTATKMAAAQDQLIRKFLNKMFGAGGWNMNEIQPRVTAVQKSGWVTYYLDKVAFLSVDQQVRTSSNKDHIFESKFKYVENWRYNDAPANVIKH